MKEALLLLLCLLLVLLLVYFLLLFVLGVLMLLLLLLLVLLWLLLLAGMCFSILKIFHQRRRCILLLCVWLCLGHSLATHVSLRPTTTVLDAGLH